MLHRHYIFVQCLTHYRVFSHPLIHPLITTREMCLLLHLSVEGASKAHQLSEFAIVTWIER